MKLIVAGSRGIKDIDRVRLEIARVERTFGGFELVCGMAQGVDLIARKLALRAGLTVHEYPAEWNLWGKRAGFIRNYRMALDADVALVLILNRSKGATHMAQAMIALGKPTIIVNIT